MDIGTLLVTIGVDTIALDKAAAEFLVFEKTTVASINRVSQRFRTIGYLMSAAVTLPIVAAGRASFKMAEDFEFSMQKIVGLAGVGQKTVDNWRQSILKMGPELAQTPQALADALYFIASSGIKGAEAMDVLQLSAKAATSGLGDVKVVADFLTSALNAYKGTGLTAAKATDILVAAVREGKAEAAGFSSAMGSVIPTAALLNVSLDKVAGAMAAITLSGSTAAQAATYLKGMFNNLMKGSETGKGAEALKSIQSSYAELRDILKNEGIIPMLDKVREGMSKYGDTLVAKVFPNIRAMTGVLSIAGKNFEYNSKIMKEVTNSTGALGKAFAAISDTIKVRFDRAISQSQTSLISLGKSVAEAVLPLLEGLTKRLSNLTATFNSLTDAQKRHRIEFALFLAVAGPAALLLSVLGYAISGLSTLVSGLRVAFVALNGVVLANPWVLLATVLVAAGGYLVHFIRKNEEASIANDKFNTTLVNVNGSLKLLKSLTSVDYSTMGIQELIATQSEVKKQLDQARKNVADAYARAGVSPEDATLGARAGKYTKYIDIQLAEGVKLKNLYTEIGTQITRWGDNFGKIPDQTKVIQETTDKLESQLKAVDNLAEAWSKAGNLINDAFTLISKGMNKDFWTMMVPPEKKDALKDYLGIGAMKFIGNKALNPNTKNEYTPAPFQLSPSQYHPVNTPMDLFNNKNVGGINGAYSETAKIMEDLGKELEFVNIKSDALGITLGKHRELFDVARAKVNVYSDALEKLLNVKERGPSWQKQVDDTIANLERMQKEFNKLQTMRDFFNGLETTFSSFFVNMMSGTQSVAKAFETMVNSIMQSFEKLIADMIAKKLVSLIMNAILPGSGSVMNMVSAPKLGEGIMGSTGSAIPQMGIGQTFAFEPVQMSIKDNTLTGFIKKANKKNSLY
jgi:TP901 family phage tail tape measure protein